jgi:hypothetical protein
MRNKLPKSEFLSGMRSAFICIKMTKAGIRRIGNETAEHFACHPAIATNTRITGFHCIATGLFEHVSSALLVIH